MESGDTLPSHQKLLQPLCREFHYLPGNRGLNRKLWKGLLPPAEFTELYKEFSNSVRRMNSGEQEYCRLNGSHYDQQCVDGDRDKFKSFVCAREDDSTDMMRSHPSLQTGLGSSDGGLYAVDAIATASENSEGDQNEGSGKKEKSGSESSNSSSQRSGGSGSGAVGGSSGGPRSEGRAGNGHSRSSDSGGDEDDDDEKRRGFNHRGDRGGGGSGGSKEPQLKSSKQQEEDDEATDSADEGGGEEDTPNSMVMDFHSPLAPQSNRSSGSEGAPPPSTTKVSALQFSGANFVVGGSNNNGGGDSSNSTNNARASHRATPSSIASISTASHFEGKHDTEESSTPLVPPPPPPLRGSTPPHPHSSGTSRSGTIAIESMALMDTNTVEPSSTVSMIVGYGVPAASAPTENKSLPGSELGTPTLDSPMLLTEKTAMPLATPVATTPILSPPMSLLPQVHIIIE